jgi:hypothetical protein
MDSKTDIANINLKQFQDIERNSPLIAAMLTNAIYLRLMLNPKLQPKEVGEEVFAMWTLVDRNLKVTLEKSKLHALGEQQVALDEQQVALDEQQSALSALQEEIAKIQAKG